MVHFGEFLKTWSLRSNSDTVQVSFNRTIIGGKCQTFKWDILSNFQTTYVHLTLTNFPIRRTAGNKELFLSFFPYSILWLFLSRIAVPVERLHLLLFPITFMITEKKIRQIVSWLLMWLLRLFWLLIYHLQPINQPKLEVFVLIGDVLKLWN